MLNQMSRLVDEYYYNVHENVLELWKEAKQSDPLKRIFAQELILEKEVSIEASKEKITLDLLDAGLLNRIYGSVFTYDEVIKVAENYDEVSENKKAREAILEPVNWAKNNFDRDYVFISPRTGKKVIIQKSSKPSRMVKHFLRKEGVEGQKDLEAILRQYSKIVTNAKIKGTLCLSIHPMDYLTVSVNNNGWSSCLDVLDGCYKAGVSALLLSPNTFVAYLKSNSKVVKYNSNEEDVWNSKIWRSLISVSDNSDRVHIGKNYPFESSELEQEVKSMLESITNIKYGEIEKRPEHTTIKTPAHLYNDASPFTGIAAMRTEDASTDNKVVCLDVSPKGHVCFICGKTYESNSSEELGCSDCIYVGTCDCCGDRVYSDEELIPVASRGRGKDLAYCSWCADRFTVTCVLCGNLVASNREGDSDYTTYVYFKDECGRVCENCMINSSEVVKDRESGEYYHISVRKEND